MNNFYEDIALYITNQILKFCKHERMIKNIVAEVYDARTDDALHRSNMIILTSFVFGKNEEKIPAIKFSIVNSSINVPDLDQAVQDIDAKIEKVLKKDIS